MIQQVIRAASPVLLRIIILGAFFIYSTVIIFTFIIIITDLFVLDGRFCLGTDGCGVGACLHGIDSYRFILIMEPHPISISSKSVANGFIRYVYKHLLNLPRCYIHLRLHYSN